MSGAKLVIEQLTPSLEVEVFEYRLTVGNAPGANGKDAVITAQSIGDVIAAAEDKTTLVDGDGIAVSNSEDGDILVEWTYGSLLAQLLAYFTTVFDFLYQPISSALTKITESGGLPLWDGAAWPGGGGGGGKWTEIDRVTFPAGVEQLTYDIFDVFSDEYDIYLIEFIDWMGKVGGENGYWQIGYGLTPTIITTGYGGHTEKSGAGTTAYSGSFMSSSGFEFNPGLPIHGGAASSNYVAMEMRNLRSLTQPVIGVVEGGASISGAGSSMWDGFTSLGTLLPSKAEHIRIDANGFSRFEGGTVIVSGGNL